MIIFTKRFNLKYQIEVTIEIKTKNRDLWGKEVHLTEMFKDEIFQKIMFLNRFLLGDNAKFYQRVKQENYMIKNFVEQKTSFDVDVALFHDSSRTRYLVEISIL